MTAQDHGTTDSASTSRAAQLTGDQKVIFRSAPVLRTAISLSVLLVASSLFGWYMLDASIRAKFTGLQIATLAFFVLFMVGMMLSIGLSTIVADARGLTVRNTVSTKFHPWSEVEGVTFGSGDAWPYLVLRPSADHPEGNNRMMLGIQRVEGDAAVERVRRLRDLVRLHAPATAE